MKRVLTAAVGVGFALSSGIASGEDFRVRPAVGLRVGTIFPMGTLYKFSDSEVATNSFLGSGYALELDAGVRVSRSWTVQTVYEGALYGGSAKTADIDHQATHFVGIGLHADTSLDRVFGFVFEIGAGYRWLNFDRDFGSDPKSFITGRKRFRYYGFEALRVGTGPRFTLSRSFSLELIAHIAAGASPGVTSTIATLTASAAVARVARSTCLPGSMLECAPSFDEPVLLASIAPPGG